MQIKFSSGATRSFIVKPSYDSRGYIQCIDNESKVSVFLPITLVFAAIRV